MDPGPVLELSAFVPAKDHSLSKQFYSISGLLFGGATMRSPFLGLGNFNAKRMECCGLP
jgi:hypothetical protein